MCHVLIPLLAEWFVFRNFMSWCFVLIRFERDRPGCDCRAPTAENEVSRRDSCFTAGLRDCNILTPFSPPRYPNLKSSFRTVMAEEGVFALGKGWAPTAIGYSIQGTLKFGLNEVFKDTYSNAVGEENALRYRAFIWAGAAASAEFFADIGLVPLEMIKVKVQTSEPGSFPTRCVALQSCEQKPGHVVVVL